MVPLIFPRKNRGNDDIFLVMFVWNRWRFVKVGVLFRRCWLKCWWRDRRDGFSGTDVLDSGFSWYVRNGIGEFSEPNNIDSTGFMDFV
jgi:hypothetical protein